MKKKGIVAVAAFAALLTAHAQRPDADDGGYGRTIGGIGWWVWYDDGLRSVALDDGQLSLSGQLTVPLSEFEVSGVLWIGDDAFRNQRHMTEITIPEASGGASYIGIEGDAFEGCSALRTVNIPSTVKWVDDEAFVGCRSLRNINAPAALLPQLRIAIRKAGLRNVTVNGESLPSAAPGAVVPGAYTKAQTLLGAVCDADGEVEGVVQVKVGKASRTGEARVSAKITMVDGRTHSSTSEKMIVGPDGSGQCMVLFRKLRLEIPLVFTVGEDGACSFEGSDNGMSLASARIGGECGDGMVVALSDPSEVAEDVPGEVQTQLLPASGGRPEPVRYGTGGRWSFDRAALVRYARNRATGDYELSGDSDPAKPNLSGMKLAYTPKTGIFKGSFKVYSIENGRLRKHSAKVSGVVVDGVGHGVATVRTLGAEWELSVAVPATAP